MNRFLKKIKKMRLTILLLLSVLVMTIVGIVNTAKGKASVRYGWKHPFVVSALMKEEKTDKKADNETEDIEVATVNDASKGGDASSTDAEDDTIDYNTVAERIDRPMEFEKIPEFTPRSPYYVYTGHKPLTTSYPYIDAPKGYYKDTLFLGDSRVEGLHDYGNIPDADFCYKEGISVFNIRKDYLVWGDDGGGTLDELLEKNQYKKIYVMLGINELGKGFADEYAKSYGTLIKYLHIHQKDVVVVVMGVMYVTKDYSDGSDVFNNDNIDARNSLVAEYIDGYDTLYLDINPAVCDKTGALNPEYTNDGLHLTAEYYKLWVDFLNKHAYQDAMFESEQ